MPRRKSGEKNKFHQALNISAFNSDPLNLSALCEKKDGTDSPELKSPVLDRSHQYEPSVVQLLDINDPLNLNHIDDPTLKPACKRKKRKRRNTGGTLTETEELACLVDHITNDSLDISINSSIVTEENVTQNTINADLSICSNKTEKHMDNEKSIEINTLSRCKRIRHNSHNKQFKFNEKNRKYRYGNYVDYNDCLRKHMVDQRLDVFRKEWFEGKNCLDVGCNTGKVTILIAKHFLPSKIVGIDIDSNLIKIAKKKTQEFSVVNRNIQKFPLSCHLTYGPILGTQLLKKSNDFPENLSFRVENIVPDSLESLQTFQPEYDCILCLNVTKWIHLNFGDVGLKSFFKKIFLLLRPGGRLFLDRKSVV